MDAPTETGKGEDGITYANGWECLGYGVYYRTSGEQSAHEVELVRHNGTTVKDRIFLGSGMVAELAAAMSREGVEDPTALRRQRDDLLTALREIAKGEGRFNRDPIQHANNAIDNMVALAESAIAKAGGTR